MNENSGSLMVAFATLDGDLMPKGHFGEAPQFDIYRLSATAATKVGSVKNPHAGERHGDESHGHHHHGSGDSQKGAGIGRVLGDHGAQVMVSRAFGPNIKRIRQRFLPVKVDIKRVTEAVALMQEHWDRVQEHWLKGEERQHLVLR